MKFIAVSRECHMTSQFTVLTFFNWLLRKNDFSESLFKLITNHLNRHKQYTIYYLDHVESKSSPVVHFFLVF